VVGFVERTGSPDCDEALLKSGRAAMKPPVKPRHGSFLGRLDSTLVTWMDSSWAANVRRAFCDANSMDKGCVELRCGRLKGRLSSPCLLWSAYDTYAQSASPSDDPQQWLRTDTLWSD